MPTSLARQIEVRLKAKNMSVLTLERLSGLKGHGVTNILRGKSKKPSAQSLNAIGNILECTVEDLLSFRDIFPDGDNIPSRDSIKQIKYKPIPLISEVTAFVMKNWDKGGQNKDQILNMQQILTCIEEIIINAVQRSLDHMDHNFAVWLLSILSFSEYIVLEKHAVAC